MFGFPFGIIKHPTCIQYIIRLTSGVQFNGPRGFCAKNSGKFIFPEHGMKISLFTIRKIPAIITERQWKCARSSMDRASDSGSECWGFESLRACHVGASVVSLAPTYFISQSALTPLLLLSKSNPLRWASIRGALWAALFTIIKISVLTVIYKLIAAFQP